MLSKTISATIAALAVLGLGASVAAAEPTGEYSVFAQCPTGNPALEGCMYAKTESGEFVVGSKTVPITNPVVLQGGIYENEETEENVFVGATNGETLSRSPQNVPGGLAGLVNCRAIEGSGLIEVLERTTCEATFENGLTGVTATTELAAPASAIGIAPGKIILESGVALRLPIKVHLENPLLGSECYVGSNATPIVLELTSGTTSPPPPNTPIKGSAGEATQNAEGTILTISNNSLVDNAFAAPGATGCGGIASFLLDPIIDSQLGVPSAAGHNTAILNGTLKSANATAVRAHS